MDALSLVTFPCSANHWVFKTLFVIKSDIICLSCKSKVCKFPKNSMGVNCIISENFQCLILNLRTCTIVIHTIFWKFSIFLVWVKIGWNFSTLHFYIGQRGELFVTIEGMRLLFWDTPLKTLKSPGLQSVTLTCKWWGIDPSLLW